MTRVYVYAVSYDLGFAPNPFGGLCSLACCKPAIRKQAVPGDWVIGLTGTKIKPAMRCIFAMVVTKCITFDDYWQGPDFATRRPVRNGTPKKQVGDNIYHRDSPTSAWRQEDSVHSLIDGSQSEDNTSHDTRVNRILLSDNFVYFGASAPLVPQTVRNALAYPRNPRDFRKFNEAQAKPLIEWLAPQIAKHPNQILADPINFAQSGKRFSPTLQRMI